MTRSHALGVLNLDAKFAIVVLTLMLLLPGCGLRFGQNAAAGSGEETPMPSPTAEVVAQATPGATIPTPTPQSSSPDAEGEPSVTEATPGPTDAPVPTQAPWVCPSLHGRTEIATLDSQAMGEQVRYLIHVPPCYDAYPTKAFPTLYLFHGWPLDEWHWVNLGISDWSDDWTNRGITGPYIVVLPGVSQDGRYVHSSGGDGSFEGAVVNELVPAIDAAYRTIDAPSGRAVGGISRGGVWALEIALRHQDVFGAVGAHSPALAQNSPLPQYDPYLLIQEGVPGLRIYLDAGDRDWARAATIKFRDRLREVGADVSYEVHSGGHVDSLWRGAVSEYIGFYAASWPASYDALPEWVLRPSAGGDG